MKSQEKRYVDEINSQGTEAVNFSEVRSSYATSFACSIPLERRELRLQNGLIAKCLLLFSFICSPRKTFALIQQHRDQEILQRLNSTEAVAPELDWQDVEFTVNGQKFPSSWGQNVLNSH